MVMAGKGLSVGIIMKVMKTVLAPREDFDPFFRVRGDYFKVSATMKSFI